MSFITPVISTIQNVSSDWYYSGCQDERYKGLTKTLDIPAPTVARVMYYIGYDKRILKDYISEGDVTQAQLHNLSCTNNMKRYRQSVPAFRYNAAVFPPYGDTKHHWYISTADKHVSLIIDSKEDILNYINYAFDFQLHFVPLLGTLQ